MTGEVLPPQGDPENEARKPLRIAAVVQNAIQFFVPHYRQITQDGRVQLKVFYLSDRGLRPFKFHGAVVQQEASVFEGYDWTILPNWSPLRRTNSVLENLTPTLYCALRDGKFDAVWFHGYNIPSLWIGFVACILNGIPILLRGESENFFPRPAWRTWIKRALLEPLFRRVAAFLYIGTHNRDFYKAFGVPEEKLFYVPYGVENRWFRGEPGERDTWRLEVRRTLGIGENTVVFANFSKHRPPKRPEDAVAAFCRLPRDTDAALLMLGDGELRANAERVYGEQGSGRNVHFLGLRPYSELRKFMAASDALVFPSEENWGMAVNEALAAGLAVICGDRVAGAVDMVSHGVNGFLFRSRDIDELAMRMTTMCTDPPALQSMKAASLRIADTMSFDVMTSNLVRAACHAAR